MSKEEILRIANNILEEGVVAVHGTSIKCAESILKTGLNGNRTTYIVIDGKRNSKALATYSWKDTAPGDSANVVITIPVKYFELLVGYTQEEAESKIEYFRNQGMEEDIIRSVMDINVEVPEQYTGTLNIPLMPKQTFNIPKEFIRGYFVYLNNTNGRSFIIDGKFDTEQALENLAFIDNPNYFRNINEEEQDKFIKLMREKMGLEQQIR